MLVNFPILYIEINYDELIFVVVKSNETDQFELEQKEKMILDNLSMNISDVIISSIINLDDN